MPTLDPLSSFNANMGSQIAGVLGQFTDLGLEVWLRFGHEMNYCFQEGASPRHWGSAQDFINAWVTMYDAVSTNPAIKMWWSPNQDGNDDYDQYGPGPQYVDIVGFDCYPNQSSSLLSDQFDSCYQSFYESHSEA